MSESVALKAAERGPIRETLFRGKRADNNQWVTGFLAFHYVEGRDSQGFLYSGKSRIYDPEAACSVDVLTSSVFEYAGRKDKEGRKIFEGDLLKCKGYRGKGVVRFVSSYFEVYFAPNIRAHLWMVSDVATVAGNVRDNPEDLEVIKRRSKGEEDSGVDF